MYAFSSPENCAVVPLTAPVAGSTVAGSEPLAIVDSSTISKPAR